MLALILNSGQCFLVLLMMVLAGLIVNKMNISDKNMLWVMPLALIIAVFVSKWFWQLLIIALIIGTVVYVLWHIRKEKAKNTTTQ